MLRRFSHRFFASLAVLALVGPSLVGCAATASEMRRAQEAYDEARFDAARIWLVDLEPSLSTMEPSMRARYFYFRGMAEYRLGHRLEALHYLAIAEELVRDRSALREEQRDLLTRTLAELQPRAPLAFWPPEPSER
jgi:hypothetical protein